MKGFSWVRRSSRRVPVNLALQGGGAHGAFTWGVLDRLLESDRIEVAALSGTSAGAINSVVLANGLIQGGPIGAREALDRFWTALGNQAPKGLTMGDGDDLRFTPMARWFMHMSQFVSPYDANPRALNPLREMLEQQIDFQSLRAATDLPIFVAATNANTGRLRIFSNQELSVDAVLASTCLPAMNQAVEIDGEPYWDGAYSANPAVFPLLEANMARDTLLVLLSPLHHGSTPRSTSEIRQRAQDIAFDNTFLREMHMLAHVRGLASDSWLRGRFENRMMNARFHLIEDSENLGALNWATRMMAHSAFLERLREDGRTCAHGWLNQYGVTLGRQSSVDLRETFG